MADMEVALLHIHELVSLVFSVNYRLQAEDYSSRATVIRSQYTHVADWPAVFHNWSANL